MIDQEPGNQIETAIDHLMRRDLISRRTFMRRAGRGGIALGALMTLPGLLAACAPSGSDKLAWLNWPAYIDISEDESSYPSIEAFTELRFTGDTGVDHILATASEIPEVVQLFTTAGDQDALARIRVDDVATSQLAPAARLDLPVDADPALLDRCPGLPARPGEPRQLQRLAEADGVVTDADVAHGSIMTQEPRRTPGIRSMPACCASKAGNESGSRGEPAHRGPRGEGRAERGTHPGHAQVRGLASPEGAEEALDRLAHRAVEVEDVRVLT